MCILVQVVQISKRALSYIGTKKNTEHTKFKTCLQLLHLDQIKLYDFAYGGCKLKFSDMPFSISRFKILSIALLMKLFTLCILATFNLSMHATIRMQLSTCVAAISPIQEKRLETKSRSFASFGKGEERSSMNPNAHLTYNFSTFDLISQI